MSSPTQEAVEILADALAAQFEYPREIAIHDLTTEPSVWQTAALCAVESALLRGRE